MSVPSIRTASRGFVGLALVVVFAGACAASATPSPAAYPIVAPASMAPSTPASMPPSAPASMPPSAPASMAPSASASSIPSASGPVVGVATTSLGPTLVGAAGLTLYTHSGDTTTSSTCTGSCTSAWPPLVVSVGTKLSAGPGAAGTLGTLTRSDGSTQVTYNGLPLYYWRGDNKAGDATGQGVGGFSAGKP